MLTQTKLQRQLQITGDGIPPVPGGIILKSLNDKNILDDNERETLKLAIDFGLLDETTREKYYKESLAGTLTPFQKKKIEEVQKGLKEDGKYDGEIDGIFGNASTNALQGLLTEHKNLQEIKDVLEHFDVKLKESKAIPEPAILPGRKPLVKPVGPENN